MLPLLLALETSLANLAFFRIGARDSPFMLLPCSRTPSRLPSLDPAPSQRPLDPLSPSTPSSSASRPFCFRPRLRLVPPTPYPKARAASSSFLRFASRLLVTRRVMFSSSNWLMRSNSSARLAEAELVCRLAWTGRVDKPEVDSSIGAPSIVDANSDSNAGARLSVRRAFVVGSLYGTAATLGGRYAPCIVDSPSVSLAYVSPVRRGRDELTCEADMMAEGLGRKDRGSGSIYQSNSSGSFCERYLPSVTSSTISFPFASADWARPTSFLI